jgi:predicted DNA-binding ribbon-helix-helix protein
MVRPSTWSLRLSGLVKRSFSLAGHRTSVALEAEFWSVLLRVAQMRGQSLSALVAAVDASRQPDRPLASALRVTALLAGQSASSATGG